jgi:diguanylate cyclase (GGDEF)-like protein
VLLSDVDNFKEINDTYGHAVGDIALERVSALMREMIRKTDVVGRYGGDEFMIIMPETDLKGGVEFAERLCEAVREINISAGRKRVPLTLSIGASALHAKLDSIDSLITRADAALYESKRDGRDRVSYIKS